MHISVLVPRGAVALSCIEGSFTLFSRVNEYLKASGRPPRFELHLVGLTTEPVVYDGFFSVRPDASIETVARTDLIIIPAVNGAGRDVIAANERFLPWIVERYRGGAEIASLCVGAFLLAATGLLDGKKCTTHWSSAGEFRQLFSSVRLVPHSIIVDETGIYSSGGALSFWNLLLYLLEKYTDRDTALFASKLFEIDIGRTSQSPFLIFSGQKDHRDELVRRVQEYIEANSRRKVSVEQLSERFAVSRRNLERRFKQATGNTVLEYIRRAKIEAAKKLLEAGRKNVTEVMYEVGYSDTKAFRIAFRRITGMPPTLYRARYHRQPV